MTVAELEFANWDLTSYFPEFQGADYNAFRDGIIEQTSELLSQSRELPALGENPTRWATFLAELEQLWIKGSHIGSYLGCLGADDVRDEAVQKEKGWLSQQWAEVEKISVAVDAAFKAASDEEFDRFLAEEPVQGAEYFLRRMREKAQKTMSPALEELVADLNVNGFSAWGRLYQQVMGRLSFELPDDEGGTKQVPMSLKYSMLEDPDPAVRKAVLESSNKSWEEFEHVVAAALNAIAGTRLKLYERRGIDHFLEPALFDSGVTRETLDAMMGAIKKKQDVPRRYHELQARLMGKEKLGFQDLGAPLPVGEPKHISWSRALDEIETAFGGYHGDLGKFAAHAFENEWIESEPREGKSSGGFCTSSKLIQESRIFMTYNSTAGDVQTLAHELGHAYHNWVMRDLRLMGRSYPMTLAETASTFAETVYTDSALADPNRSELDKAHILNTRLDGASAFMLNIPMRYQFEKAFYEERQDGEVSISRLKELLLEAQRDCYGDILDEDQMDPMFWASKLHFYITGVSFYNFPYSFGYLFSLGVYARARAAGADFQQNYIDLLRMTGSDTAENVARRSLGVDLESEEFWLDSIALVEKDVERFEALMPTLEAAVSE